MKLHWGMPLLLTALVCLLQSNLGASEKPGPDKKKEETKKEEPPAKDVIVNDELINADVKDTVLAQSFCKTYVLKMIQGRAYHIQMTSPTLNPYLRLENPDGQQVATNNFGGGIRTASIFYQTPKTGNYQIVATTQNTAMGKFTLTIKEVPGAKPIEMKNQKGLGTYTGILAQTDSRYENKIHKLFLFPMEEGKTYKIDHSSRAMDAYLYLEDPGGKLLDQNDDNGESLDSRIIHRATKTGKYRIVATSLGGQGVGQFTLTIRQTDPDPNKEKAPDKNK